MPSVDKDKLRDWRKKIPMTQEELANDIGVSRQAVSLWEKGEPPTEANLKKLREKGFESGLSSPGFPVTQGYAAVPYIGLIRASSVIDWTELDNSDTTEPVPGSWDTKDCVTCRTDTDSMLPLIESDDVLMFVKDQNLKVNRVILFKTFDGLWCIKQLKYQSGEYVLRSLNSKYEDARAEGEQVGYLRGIIKGKVPNQDTYYREFGEFSDVISRLM